MNARCLTFTVFAVSLLALSPLAFHSKWPLVFFRFDGIYLLIFATMQKAWSIGGWDFTSNPLQGIGGLDLPQHSILLDPANASPTPRQRNETSRTIRHSGYFL